MYNLSTVRYFDQSCSCILLAEFFTIFIVSWDMDYG